MRNTSPKRDSLIASPKKPSHHRHILLRIWPIPKSPFYSIWYHWNSNRPHDLTTIMDLYLFGTLYMTSAAILRVWDHVYPLRTLLASSHIKSTDLSPPKNRPAQNHSRHMRILHGLIYGRRVSSNRTVLGKTPHPLCDSSNRRQPPDGLISHREAKISNVLLVTTVLYSVVLYSLTLLLLDYNSVPSISTKLTLRP